MYARQDFVTTDHVSPYPFIKFRFLSLKKLADLEEVCFSSFA
ncbi:hypothetical protein CTL2C_585 [Chlamydia trachomatis L2c]|nr:hypothetical protein CTL2C_585 [Chlamydia trachomatis L2c]